MFVRKTVYHFNFQKSTFFHFKVKKGITVQPSGRRPYTIHTSSTYARTFSKPKQLFEFCEQVFKNAI